MTIVMTEALDLYYEVAGSGPEVLFISGAGADLRHDPNPLDGPLAGRFTVAAYDQRGLGQSSVPDGPYEVADYAFDAVDLLDDLGWADAAVVGDTSGGMVALEVAIRYPERVRALALCGTAAGGDSPAHPLHHLEHLPADERAPELLELLDIRCTADWLADRPELVEQTIERLEARDAAMSDDPRGRQGYAWQLDAHTRHDTLDRLGMITAPTLIAGGRYDGVAPPHCQETLAARIPGSTLAWFECGHNVLHDDPAALDQVAEFFTATV